MLKRKSVGKTVTIKGIYFTVIGVFKVATYPRMESNDMVFIPFTTYNKMFNNGDVAEMFAVVGKDNADLAQIEDHAKRVLKEKYHVLLKMKTPMEVLIWGKNSKANRFSYRNAVSYHYCRNTYYYCGSYCHFQYSSDYSKRTY